MTRLRVFYKVVLNRWWRVSLADTYGISSKATCGGVVQRKEGQRDSRQNDLGRRTNHMHERRNREETDPAYEEGI